MQGACTYVYFFRSHYRKNKLPFSFSGRGFLLDQPDLVPPKENPPGSVIAGLNEKNISKKTEQDCLRYFSP